MSIRNTLFIFFGRMQAGRMNATTDDDDR